MRQSIEGTRETFVGTREAFVGTREAFDTTRVASKGRRGPIGPTRAPIAPHRVPSLPTRQRKEDCSACQRARHVSITANDQTTARQPFWSGIAQPRNALPVPE